MIDLTALVIISTIGIAQGDGSFDLDWELQLYEEHELYEYQMACSPQTSGCTHYEKQYIAMYLPFKNGIPMWGGGTVLGHEILHAQGLNHEQIRDCCPNPIYEEVESRYTPYDKSPKFLHSLHFNNELRFK